MLFILSLTGKILAHFRDEVKPFFNFFFTFFSRNKCLVSWLFAWDKGVLHRSKFSRDKFSFRSLTHLGYYGILFKTLQAFFSLFLHYFPCRKSLTTKDLRRGASGPQQICQVKMDARVGIEPTMGLLQRPALPFGYPALLSKNIFTVY